MKYSPLNLKPTPTKNAAHKAKFNTDDKKKKKRLSHGIIKSLKDFRVMEPQDAFDNIIKNGINYIERPSGNFRWCL